MTALGIGMVGESTFEFILHPFFELVGIPVDSIHWFTIGGAFVIATFLHVVVGELAPKTIAIQKAEAVTLMFAKPIQFFYKVMYPVHLGIKRLRALTAPPNWYEASERA